MILDHKVLNNGKQIVHVVLTSENKALIYFEHTTTRRQWVSNFCFGLVSYRLPYRDMPEKFYVHRGFFHEAYKPHRDNLFYYLQDHESEIDSLTILGASRGSSPATFFIEDLLYHKKNKVFDINAVVTGKAKDVTKKGSGIISRRITYAITDAECEISKNFSFHEIRWGSDIVNKVVPFYSRLRDSLALRYGRNPSPFIWSGKDHESACEIVWHLFDDFMRQASLTE